MNRFFAHLFILILTFCGCSPRQTETKESSLKQTERAESGKVFKISTVHAIKNNPKLEKLVRDAYEKIGYQVELVLLPSQRSLEENQSNPEIDAEFARARGAAQSLPQCLIVPVAIHHTKSVCFVKDKNLKIENLEDLKKYSVCTVRGFPVVEEAMEIYSPQVVTTTVQAMKMLNEGRVQVVVVIQTVGDFTLQELKLEGITITGPPVTEHKLYHFINKRHKSLIPDLAKALSELSGNEIEKD